MLIDLFSGAGGLSEGFFRRGFDFISHIEMDSNAIETLKTRQVYHILRENGVLSDYYEYVYGNISLTHLMSDNKDLFDDFDYSFFNLEITNSNENLLIDKIYELMKAKGINKIQGVIGGPPCQAYSVAGRSRDPNCMLNDKRNYLYKHYINFLNEFKPDFFIFENVPGMLSAKNREIIKDFFSKLKLNKEYKIESKILNSKDFGVLQSRKRLIVVGYSFDCDNFLDFESKFNNNYKVNDLLDDLPSLQPGEGMDLPQEYSCKKSEYLKKYNLRTKKDKVLSHQARTHNIRDREIYRNVIQTWNNEKRRIKYNELPKNLITHKNTKSFLDRYKIVAGDLPYSHTITAHISKDGHYFIHPDIKQARSLTVREVARIQSFPDNFKFEGSRTSQYKQIGNAVPPLMAESFAEKISELM